MQVKSVKDNGKNPAGIMERIGKKAKRQRTNKLRKENEGEEGNGTKKDGQGL
jgi:hypothetical protein